MDTDELDKMAQICRYVDFVDFCNHVDDRWDWHIDELCSSEKLPYVDFLKDEIDKIKNPGS